MKSVKALGKRGRNRGGGRKGGGVSAVVGTALVGRRSQRSDRVSGFGNAQILTMGKCDPSDGAQV